MEFNKDKMEKFLEQDRLLKFVVKDLVERGNLRDDALNVTFNTYVLGDSAMENEYLSL